MAGATGQSISAGPRPLSLAQRLARSPLALFAAILIVRSAGFVFGVLNIDESDYMLAGEGLWRGLLPYRDLVEIKPPLGYLTYAPAGLGHHLSVLPIRSEGVLWVFCTALLLKLAVETWRKSPAAGWAAAWLYVLATLCEVPSFGSEIMMNLPTAAALFFFARAQRAAADASAPAAAAPRLRWDLLCGLCLGAASLYRHQGAIGGVAIGLAILAQDARASVRLGRFGALLAGSLLPWAAVTAFYLEVGQLPAFVDWVFLRNLSYAGTGATDSVLPRALHAVVLCTSAALLPWICAARECLRARDLEPTRLGFVLLLGLTCLAVSVGGRFYEHYFLQFAPVLAVLGAPVAASWAARLRQLRRPLRFALFAALAGPVGVYLVFTYARGLTAGYPEQEPRAIEIARFIEAHSEPGERLFVWGHYTPLYLLSHRLPGSRYYNASPLIGNFDPHHLRDGFDAAAHASAPDVRAVLEDLQAQKPALFVDTAPSDLHDWARVPLAGFAALDGYVHDCYEPIGTPAGALVYRRSEKRGACALTARR